jgi:hypothetical protein
MRRHDEWQRAQRSDRAKTGLKEGVLKYLRADALPSGETMGTGFHSFYYFQTGFEERPRDEEISIEICIHSDDEGGVRNKVRTYYSKSRVSRRTSTGSSILLRANKITE